MTHHIIDVAEAIERLNVPPKVAAVIGWSCGLAALGSAPGVFVAEQVAENLHPSEEDAWNRVLLQVQQIEIENQS